MLLPLPLPLLVLVLVLVLAGGAGAEPLSFFSSPSGPEMERRVNALAGPFARVLPASELYGEPPSKNVSQGYCCCCYCCCYYCYCCYYYSYYY
jgi:hypothetical protein